ncbi:glucan synthase [Balamuthia mandrillaris]
MEDQQQQQQQHEGTEKRPHMLQRTPSFQDFAKAHPKTFEEIAAKYTSASVILCGLAADGNMDTLKELLENTSVSPNTADYDGRTPLHLAAEEGRTEVVKYLISKGANVNAADRWGTTPLRGAIAHLHNEVAEVLREYGASMKTEQTAKQSLDAVQTEEELEKLKQKLIDLSEDGTIETISRNAVENMLYKEFGLKANRLPVLSKQLDQITEANLCISWPKLRELFRESHKGLLQRALKDELSVNNWIKFTTDVTEMCEQVRKDCAGKGRNADYIPELAQVDPTLFGLSIMTVDGQRYNYGNFNMDFSCQSVGKALLYAISLEELGTDVLHKYVGREPSGRRFNDFTLNDDKKPHNPVINSGGIMVSSLFKPEMTGSLRFSYLKQRVSDLAGGLKVGFSQTTYLSEKDTAYTNYALANFMKAQNAFPPKVDIMEACDFYLQLCSLEVTCEILASIGATFANNGTSPLSQKKELGFNTVKNALQIMYSCGMYDYSGEWACTTGLPAKSGVSGCILLVVPGVMGICVWSPPLDKIGNSYAGVEFCKRFTERFGWSVFDVLFRMVEQ